VVLFLFFVVVVGALLSTFYLLMPDKGAEFVGGTLFE